MMSRESFMDPVERKVVPRGDVFMDRYGHYRRHRIAVFSGRTVIGETPTRIVGRVAKDRYGWAALLDTELDRPDIPALKVAAGELPMTGKVSVPVHMYTGFDRSNPYPLASEAAKMHKVAELNRLFGTSEQVMRSLREVHRLAGRPYILPDGRRSY
jgi:hypothetical protein